MTAIASVLTFVFVAGLLVRLASFALNETGLSDEVARFQSWSALTGTGFTTSEAEVMVGYPVRRRIALGLLILGAAGLTTVVTGSIVGFVTADGAGEAGGRALVLVAGLVVIVTLFRSHRIDGWLRSLLARRARRWVRNAPARVPLAAIGPGHSVTALFVGPDSALTGRTIGEVAASTPAVSILCVRRNDSTYLDHPPTAHEITAGQALFLFGPNDQMEAWAEPGDNLT